MSPYTTVDQLILTFRYDNSPRRGKDRNATKAAIKLVDTYQRVCNLFRKLNRDDMPFALLLLTTFVREVIAPTLETQLRRAVVRTYDYGHMYAIKRTTHESGGEYA